jgi:hypothetical protein
MSMTDDNSARRVASLAFTVQRNKKPQLHYTLHVILQDDNYKAKGVSLEQPIFSNHDEL